MIARVLCLLFLFCGAPAFATEEAEGPYLNDLLGVEPYLAAWNQMLAGASAPDWVADYASTFDGPSSPATTVEVGGEPYTLSWVCKVHDCGDNQLYVLFAPGGAQAWGLLITGGSNRSWLGGPDGAIQEAILSGVQ